MVKPVPELETERVVLRPVRATDAPAWFRFRSDPLSAATLRRLPYASVNDASARIEYLLRETDAGTMIAWTLFRRHTGEPFGMAGIHRIDAAHLTAEIAYEAERSHRGQGLVREAVATMLSFGFTGLGLHRLEARVDTENQRSIRLVSALGFTLEGRRRQDTLFQGRFYDTGLWSLLATDR